MSFKLTDIELHIVLYSQKRYVHDIECIDLQKLISNFDESFSPALLGCNPKETYLIVWDLWMKVVEEELKVNFWRNLYRNEKLTCMAGTIEKMLVMIGENTYAWLPEPDPNILRVQQ